MARAQTLIAKLAVGTPDRQTEEEPSVHFPPPTTQSFFSYVLLDHAIFLSQLSMTMFVLRNPPEIVPIFKKKYWVETSVQNRITTHYRERVLDVPNQTHTFIQIDYCQIHIK